MVIKIVRIERDDSGVFGALVINGEAFCVTLEPEDLNNEECISCIPEGIYHCARVESPAFGETFMVLDVPGRSHILFHAGNTEEDTHGCILLGLHFGKLKGVRGILNSGKTFKKFMGKLEEVNSFALEITVS